MHGEEKQASEPVIGFRFWFTRSWSLPPVGSVEARESIGAIGLWGRWLCTEWDPTGDNHATCLAIRSADERCFIAPSLPCDCGFYSYSSYSTASEEMRRVQLQLPRMEGKGIMVLGAVLIWGTTCAANVSSFDGVRYRSEYARVLGIEADHGERRGQRELASLNESHRLHEELGVPLYSHNEIQLLPVMPTA